MRDAAIKFRPVLAEQLRSLIDKVPLLWTCP